MNEEINRNLEDVDTTEFNLYEDTISKLRAGAQAYTWKDAAKKRIRRIQYNISNEVAHIGWRIKGIKDRLFPHFPYYMSFVGTFDLSDPFWGQDYPNSEVEDGEDWLDVANQDARDFIRGAVEGMDILEQESKDSLTVTIYSDPLGKAGWGLVVADCDAGGWVEYCRVKLSSFKGNAQVAPGCAVRILQGN